MFKVTVIVLLITVLILVYILSDKTVMFYNASLDSKYNVLKDDEAKMIETSNALAEIHSNVNTLIEYLRTHDASSSLLKTLGSRYTKGIISEAVIEKGSTSYTIDKQNIHLCLRSRDSIKQVYDINTLMYVVLHELAHVVSKSIGHNDEFKTNFKYLVSSAIQAKVYTYVNYSKTPVHYCGINLTTNILN